jgi:NAD(P)-dependent dehydrogenase (short-subunit alcohol dehydrogenase family)
MITTDWLGLRDRVAVVTGAAGGIGRGIALELGRAGARVAILDLDEAGAKETADLAQAESACEALAYAADISDSRAVDEVAAAVSAALGPVDVLVNNAGILRPAALADVGIDDWERALRVNVTGYLLCAQAFGRPMLRRGSGSVVHVSSVAASHPQAASGAYSPSKAAVSMLSRQLAFEWGPYGVRSNVVAPGLIRTPLSEAFYQAPGVLEARSAVVPARRVGTPQDLADVVAWLVSDRAGYVTGQEIAVDGGFTQTLMSHVPRPGF